MTESISTFHTYNRPIKEAFIVNPEDPDIQKQLELIIDYCQKRWGGGYNQIIEFQDNEISDIYFNNLKVFDPDVIRTFIDLPETLILKFKKELSPLYIEKLQYRDNNIGIRNCEGALLKPIPQYTSLFKKTRPYALFKITNYEFDPLLKKFLLANFGIYDNVISTQYHYTDINKEIFEIASEDDFKRSLLKLAPFNSKKYYFQSELCNETNLLDNINSKYYSKSFLCFIGKTPRDLIYFWNFNLVLQKYLRNGFKGIYVPYEFIENNEYKDLIQELFFGSNSHYGHEYDQGVKFLSTSLEEKELEKISKILMSKNSSSKSFQLLNNPFNLDDINAYKCKDSSALDTNRLIDQKVYIKIPPPDNKFAEYLDGNWMTEFYIPFNIEKYGYYTNTTYHFKLPRLNYLAQELLLSNSRINKEGIPTALIEKKNSNIEFNIPDEKKLFLNILLYRPNKNIFYLDDLRKNIIDHNNEKITDIRKSDKGQYLEGFLDIFDGIGQLEKFLGDNFWLDIFKHLSGQKNENVEKSTKDKLRKHLCSINDPEFIKSDEGIEYLSKLTISVSKQLKSLNKTIDYKYLIEEAEKTYENYVNSQEFIKRYNSWKPKQRYLFSEGELKENLKKLVDLNILQMGLNLKCDSCGLKSWHHVDNLGRVIDCPGCLAEFNLYPEVKWSYKLNSLVKDGFSDHGLTAVSLTLNYFLNKSRESFFYIPSIDIYLNSCMNPFCDLDIICISDGKLIIGEVKQSQSLFKPGDFEKMLKIAQIIKPNSLIFSALDLNRKNRPKTLLLNQIKDLQIKLEPLNIKVMLIPLDKDRTSDFVEWFDCYDYPEEKIRTESYNIYQKRNNQTSCDDWREAEKKVLKKEMESFYRKYLGIKF